MNTTVNCREYDTNRIFIWDVIVEYWLRDGPILLVSFRVVCLIQQFVEQEEDVLVESFPKLFHSKQ